MDPKLRQEIKEIVETILCDYVKKEEVKRMIHEQIEEHIADRHYTKNSDLPRSERAYL